MTNTQIEEVESSDVYDQGDLCIDETRGSVSVHDPTVRKAHPVTGKRSRLDMLLAASGVELIKQTEISDHLTFYSTQNVPLDLSLPRPEAATSQPEIRQPRLKVRCDLVSLKPRSRSPSRSPYLVLGREEEYVRFSSSSENYATFNENYAKSSENYAKSSDNYAKSSKNYAKFSENYTQIEEKCVKPYGRTQSTKTKRDKVSESIAGLNSESPAVNTGIWNLTVQDIDSMLGPYITHEDKKYKCTVCSIKFNTKPKAISHVENKHVDCFQYKCPQCRTTKTSRLAIDCHTRSRHNDKSKLLTPLLRLKRQFGLKGEKGGAGGVNTKMELNKGGYDLMFVTFLRDELTIGDVLSTLETWRLMETIQARPRSSSTSPSSSPASSPAPSHSTSRDGSVSPRNENEKVLASWMKKDHGIFVIHNREQFASKWFFIKGVKNGSWARLETEVLSNFVDRHILKQISVPTNTPSNKNPCVFQVFCIRQLLQ